MRQATPTAFPSQHVVLVTVFTMAVYMLLYVVYSSVKKKDAFLIDKEEDKSSRTIVIWLLLAALGVRLALSCMVVGHKTDINCFTAWGNSLFTKGTKSFYNGSMPDYPPGYMYVLGLMSAIASGVFHHGVTDAFGNYDLIYVALIKLPSIIADLVAAYFIYRLARKKLKFAPSILLMAIVAFNPLMMYISSGWGQIDQILTVLIVLAIFALQMNKPILGGVIYGLAILMKPQALMVGPLLALAYMIYIFEPNTFIGYGNEKLGSLGTRILKTVAAVLLACLMIIVSAIPFSTEQMPWYSLIVQKYLGTATSYKYASVNAYNIFTLFGKNWAPVSEKSFIGLNYGTLGTLGMIISVLGGGAIYYFGRKKSKGALYLAAAFTFSGLFTLGHYMHERYMFPVLLLVLTAYLYYGDRRLLYVFFAYSATAMLNCLSAFYYSQYHEYALYWDRTIVFVGSLLNVLLFVAFAVLCVLITVKGRTVGDVFRGEIADDATDKTAAKSGKQLKKAR